MRYLSDMVPQPRVGVNVIFVMSKRRFMTGAKASMPFSQEKTAFLSFVPLCHAG